MQEYLNARSISAGGVSVLGVVLMARTLGDLLGLDAALVALGLCAVLGLVAWSPQLKVKSWIERPVYHLIVTATLYSTAIGGNTVQHSDRIREALPAALVAEASAHEIVVVQLPQATRTPTPRGRWF